MTNKDLIKVFAYAQAIFTNFTVPTGELEAQTTSLIWLKFLKPYPLEIIYSAIDEYARENKFISIAQIADLCKKAQDIVNGTHQTTETYLKELELAVDRAGTYESANNAYDSLSDLLKSIIPGYWTLGKMHNEGFEYYASRYKEEIKDKLCSKSLETSIVKNTKLLLGQSPKQEPIKIEGETH